MLSLNRYYILPLIIISLLPLLTYLNTSCQQNLSWPCLVVYSHHHLYTNNSSTLTLPAQFITTTNQTSLNLCPEISTHMGGTIQLNKNSIGTRGGRVGKVVRVKRSISDDGWRAVIDKGGRWRPKECVSRHRVGVVIPFRDRDAHLPVLLPALHTLLQNQENDYIVLLVEQDGTQDFNRGMLFNVGFHLLTNTSAIESLKWKEDKKLKDVDEVVDILSTFSTSSPSCIVFHDVDLVPENDKNSYQCEMKPVHLSSAIDKYKYKLPFPHNFGGVCAFTPRQFRSINGFSNEFWGWGGEDDDLYLRVLHQNLTVLRYPSTISRYTSLKHTKARPAKLRWKNLRSGEKRYTWDGLSDLQYTITALQLHPLYTKISVILKPVITKSKH